MILPTFSAKFRLCCLRVERHIAPEDDYQWHLESRRQRAVSDGAPLGSQVGNKQPLIDSEWTHDDWFRTNVDVTSRSGQQTNITAMDADFWEAVGATRWGRTGIIVSICILLPLHSASLASLLQVSYVSGDWHISTHADPTSTHRAPIRPILGFWESKVHKNCDSLPWTPMNRRWTAEQNLTPVALSSSEKSVTVQTKKTNTQTNSKRYIHTFPIGMCG